MRVPHSEMLRIREEQKIDRAWWDHVPSFADDRAVAQAEKRGLLLRVRDGVHYKISANAKPDYRVLTPATIQLLQLVSGEWAHEMARLNLRSHFLVVSSLTRPTVFQQKLAAEGRPALPHSSHEKGLAFDLSVGWFRRHVPIAAGTLETVLRRRQQTGYLNAIDEPSVQVFHVCVSPRFVGRCETPATLAI